MSIGSGTATAKLHVNGTSGNLSTTAGDLTRYIHLGSGSSVAGGSGFVGNFGGVSIYANGNVAAGGSFISTTRFVSVCILPYEVT